MNKPLVERIDELQDLDFVNRPTLCRMTMKEILDDVRELIEAAKGVELMSNTVIACYTRNPGNFAVAVKELRGEQNRISAILRKVDGDIGTAPSLPAGESQNSAVKVPDDVMESAEFLAQWCPGHELYRDHASAILSFLQSITQPTETPR